MIGVRLLLCRWGTDPIRSMLAILIVYPTRNGTAAVVLRSVSGTLSGLRLKKSPALSLSVS